MNKSNAFDSDNIEEFYNRKLILCKESNVDCSEVVEDFISSFGGSALLILSNEYDKNHCIEFLDSYGDKKYYVYHYAWVSDGLVCDPMLGYFNLEVEKYLEEVVDNTSKNYSVRIINEKNLKCYGGML